MNHYYCKYYKLWKSKTEIVYNAIDYSNLPVLNYHRCDNQRGVNLLFVGRLDTQKDPITLLQAFDLVVNKYGKNECQLTFVGDGEYMKKCVKYIEEHNLGNNVILAGWVDDVSIYYSRSDIFCLSSIYESFGLIFLEAGHYSLPSVATNVEGIPEVIEDKVTGFLVPPRNPQLMADNLLFLINSPEVRKKMGNDAKILVESKFTLQKMETLIAKIYC